MDDFDFDAGPEAFDTAAIDPSSAADLFGARDEDIQGYIGDSMSMKEPYPDVLAKNTTSEALDLDDFELPPVQIKNIIAAVNLGCELDLRLITISTRNIEYNPQRATQATLRIREPRVTCTIFPNGRVAVLGARSVLEARRGLYLAAKIIKKAGHPDARFRNFRIETLVCSACCGFPIRLENLATDHSAYCHYEPEIFCGVIYRYHPEESKKASVLIFVSGKMIITGCKTVELANEVYKNVYALLYRYRG